MVVYLTEVQVKVKTNKDKKSVCVVVSNLSVNLLDQSKWISSSLNPLCLMPGLADRPSIRLGDGPCSYLEFLGFI